MDTDLARRIESYFNKTCLLGSIFDENLPDNVLFQLVRKELSNLSVFSDTWKEEVKIKPVGINKMYEMSLAHVGVIVRGLPALFSQWGISSYLGNKDMSVAALAAHLNRLPSHFKDWHIADDNGWTVAHTYALRRDMPPTFTDWDLKTNIDVTVRDVQRLRPSLY